MLLSQVLPHPVLTKAVRFFKLDKRPFKETLSAFVVPSRMWSCLHQLWINGCSSLKIMTVSKGSHSSPGQSWRVCDVCVEEQCPAGPHLAAASHWTRDTPTGAPGIPPVLVPVLLTPGVPCPVSSHTWKEGQGRRGGAWEHLTQSLCWEGARCRPRPTQARLQAPEDPHPNLAPRESCCLERSGGLLAGEVPPISFLRQMELGRRLAPLYSVLWLALPTGVFLSSFDSDRAGEALLLGSWTGGLGWQWPCLELGLPTGVGSEGWVGKAHGGVCRSGCRLWGRRRRGPCRGPGLGSLVRSPAAVPASQGWGELKRRQRGPYQGHTSTSGRGGGRLQSRAPLTAGLRSKCTEGALGI